MGAGTGAETGMGAEVGVSGGRASEGGGQASSGPEGILLPTVGPQTYAFYHHLS